MAAVRSSLSRIAAQARDPDPEAAWEAARAAWQLHGLALLNPDEVERKLGWIAGQEAKLIAEKCFGKRKTEK